MLGPLRNPKHEAFCQYYVFGHPPSGDEPEGWRRKEKRNATRSYQAAGYRSKGPTATAAAMRLLRREDIRARIEELDR